MLANFLWERSLTFFDDKRGEIDEKAVIIVVLVVGTIGALGAVVTKIISLYNEAAAGL